MKEFFKMFFASMLANIVGGLFMIFIFIIVVAGIAAAVSGGVKGGKSKEGNVLVIDLSDRIKENDESNELAVLDDESDLKTGLYNTCKTIEDAKNNSEIKGIYLKLNNARNSWATLQQLREALVSFKKSGKFIVSYGEVISQRAYYVASAGTAIYLNPSGDLEHKGMAATLAFYKGLLDKLDIQPEIFYAGKFKSATEPFRADKMSEPNRLQITQLINGMWSEYLLAAAEFTKSDTATLHKLAYQQAINFPSDAFNNKMVTALYYWDQVEAAMKDKVGKDIKYITLNDYASKHIDLSIKATNKIAVLVAEGSIVDGQQTDDDQIASKNFCEEIRKIKNNDSVKAVVLRINSPGGSALASEVILRELTLLQQKKHIVVSMGDYAASGGYYIASLADSIFAMPNTVTGSIGVFGMIFSIDKLMKNKLGITYDGVKNTPSADVPTVARPLTPAEAQRTQASVDSIYQQFMGHVATGRKLSIADVDSIAQGRVWTGAQAVGIHLVDKVGGINDAIACAARYAKVSDYKVVLYPKGNSKLQMILQQLKNSKDSKALVGKAVKEELGNEAYQSLKQVENLKAMNGRAQAALPWTLSID